MYGQLSSGASGKLYTTPNVACAIQSGRPGVTHRKVWNVAPIPGITPGTDANNLNLTFALLDNYGLPTINVAYAPNIDDYIAGAQTGNTAGFAATMCDCWLLAPVGVNSIRLQARTFGTHSFGIYVGRSFRFAQRIAWNVGGFTSTAIDLSSFTLLCNRRLIALRMYTCNGYFNYGFFTQWDVGAGFVDVPTASTHGEQPGATSWP